MNRKYLSILFFIFGLVALRSGILNMYTFSNLELCLSVGLGTGTTLGSIIFYIKIIAGPRCTKCNSIEWRLVYWKNYWQLPLFRQPEVFVANSSEGFMGHENPEWKAKGYTLTNCKIKKEAK